MGSGPSRVRSARGQRRRQELLEAAAGLIAEQGFAAVSHRSVAQRAALPLAATTYYFSSLDELVEQAFRLLADQWLDQARGVLSRLPARLDGPEEVGEAVVLVAAGLTDVAGDGEAADGQVLLAVYERYLEAGRHPQLRPLVAAYNAQVDQLIQEVLTRGGVREGADVPALTLAQVDGAVLRALAEGAAPVPAARAAATAVVRLLIRADAANAGG